MTHDELLARIDKYLIPTMKQEPNFNGAIGILKALRAVVELHKPKEIETGGGTFTICSVCLGSWNNGTPLPVPITYPCPTIQAITDNLK